MKFKNLLWGLFFIAAGVVIILNQLGYFIHINPFSLIITLLLIPVILKSSVHLNFSGILFPLAILCIIYAKPLGIEYLTPWPLLGAALMGTIGLHLIFGPSKWRGHVSSNNVDSENFEHVINCEDDKVIDFKVNFSSAIKYVNSKELQKIILKCSFGAMKVYFDQAVLHPEGAEINLDISFAGGELYIPKSWNVVNKANVSLGAIEEKNSRQPSDGPNVYLTGNVSFAGLEIIYI